MLQTHAGLCHFMVRTVLTVAGYWAVSSVSSFLPRKLTWDRTAVAHSQSCTLGYLNLLSSCPRRTSCQECLEGICSKTRHKLHFESITGNGRFTGPWEEQEAWVRPCSPVAVALSGKPWPGWWAAPGPSAVSGLNSVAAWCHRWKGALIETLREIRPGTCLCKDLLNPASPNYTFIVAFCVLNCNLQILHLITMVFYGTIFT